MPWEWAGDGGSQSECVQTNLNKWNKNKDNKHHRGKRGKVAGVTWWQFYLKYFVIQIMIMVIFHLLTHKGIRRE